MTFKWFKLSFVHENIVNAVIILVDICNNVIVSNDNIEPCYLMTKWLQHSISLSSVHINPILGGLWNYVTGRGGHYGPHGF